MKRYYKTVPVANDQTKQPARNIDESIEAALLAIVQEQRLHAYPRLIAVSFLQGSTMLFVTVIAEEATDGK